MLISCAHSQNCTCNENIAVLAVFHLCLYQRTPRCVSTPQPCDQNGTSLRAVDPAVPDWDLAPVTTPTPTIPSTTIKPTSTNESHTERWNPLVSHIHFKCLRHTNKAVCDNPLRSFETVTKYKPSLSASTVDYHRTENRTEYDREERVDADDMWGSNKTAIALNATYRDFVGPARRQPAGFSTISMGYDISKRKSISAGRRSG
ncbi:hypothetical protein ARMSODRAFT_193310 [Armillaria solidipes]|uniref:Uncharacterized protein n=1 Tax=Armillaria solidipes TaxID=1076256 RepID=A0A2H3BPA8_9AGAR|nr:hypothetical protein ARMSODRAFT_193310 [Armillaria solidipes]